MTAVAVAARRSLPVATIALLAVVIGAELVRQPTATRLIVAACIGVCAFPAAAQWPERTAVALMLLLPFLAFGRRLLLEFTGWQSADPLLLVAPAIVALLVVRLFVLERRELAGDTISKLVLVVVGLTILQVVNPRGGGVTAGVAGLLFTAVPLCWYFVGREIITQRGLRTLFGGLVVVSCVVAIYGLNQTWNGLPGWDLEWFRTSGYEALYVGETVRAFGTFSSSAEHGTYLAIGIVVAIAFALGRRPQLLLAVPLLAVALFYESSRGSVVATVFATLVVVAARTGSLRRTVVTLAICLVGVTFAFVFLRGGLQAQASSSSDDLVSHQLSGLADPFNSDTSTLPFHIGMFRNGVGSGLLDPIGEGVASTTLSGSKFGSEESASTEVDISNVFVSLGTFGGIAYVALVLLVLRAALRLAVERRDAVSLAALGTLVVALGQWLNGGYYAVSPLVWLIAGFVVAASAARGHHSGGREVAG